MIDQDDRSRSDTQIEFPEGLFVHVPRADVLLKRKSYGVARATNSFFPIRPLVNFHVVEKAKPNNAVTEFPDPMTIIARFSLHDLAMAKKFGEEFKDRGRLVLARFNEDRGDWDRLDQYEVDRMTLHPGYGGYVVIKVYEWLDDPSNAWGV